MQPAEFGPLDDVPTYRTGSFWMSLTALYPFASRHAVQSATMVMAWEAAISDEYLTEVQALRGALKADFGAMHLNQRITFNMLDPSSGVSAPGIGGVNFVRGNVPDITRSLQVQEKIVQLTSNDYDRWVHFIKLVQRSFKTLGPVVAKGRKLASVQLQYVDTFMWKGDPKNLQLSEIFDSTSPYLPQNIFTLGNDFWHSHHGFFSTREAPENCRLLDNVNVQRAPKEGTSEHVLTIVTNHQLLPKDEIWSPEGCLDFLNTHSAFLHDRNKAMLSSLLTDEVKGLISLWGST
ncbi:hypothetical protein B5P43_25775 [Bacillus sp. SRB_336]|nr:hypothetical protein B5P43_25775 [Bacillus sp. SRB_336]